MTLEDMDTGFDMEEAPLPEETSNRPFFIVAGILAAFTLIALACIAVYALYYVPMQRSQQATQVAQLNAQNTEVAAAITQTSIAAALIAKPTETPAWTPTSMPTSTPVVIIPTNTTVPTTDHRTATVAALLTQAAVAQQTLAPTGVGPTPTALPSTGFMDEVGVPGLLGLAAILIVVIFLSRRLRTAN